MACRQEDVFLAVGTYLAPHPPCFKTVVCPSRSTAKWPTVMPIHVVMGRQRGRWRWWEWCWAFSIWKFGTNSQQLPFSNLKPTWHQFFHNSFAALWHWAASPPQCCCFVHHGHTPSLFLLSWFSPQLPLPALLPPHRYMDTQLSCINQF